MGGFQTRSWGVQELLLALERCSVVLPEFQRDFVWNPKDINLLLVSLASDFPAGSLLFLTTGAQEDLGWRPVTGVEADGQPSPTHLVLDGQQRLTSLALALQGRGEHLFFLDLARFDSEGAEGALVHLRRDQAEKRALVDRWMQFEQRMYPLSAALADDVEDENWFEDYAEHHHVEHGADRLQLRTDAREMKRRFVEPLRGYRFPVIELPSQTSLEAVCTIFETLNKTGMKLTVFDLLTAKFWPRGLDLRAMLTDARTRWPLLGEDEFDVEANYLLQAVSLIRSREAPKCKRGDVLELSAEGFAEDWPRVCQAASSALTTLRDDCGVLGPAWMPYMALMPCLIATVVHVGELQGPAQAAAWQKVKRWFWCACFAQRYDGPANTLNAADYRALLLWIEDDEQVPEAVRGFALDELELQNVRRQRAAIYRAVICLTITHGARDFHTGQRLTSELLRDPELRIDDHHIVPTGFLKRQAPPIKGEDSVLNRCLIDAITNRTISDKPPPIYLAEIAEKLGEQELVAILDSHLIPCDESSALRREPFDLRAFMDERNRHLLPQIAAVTGVSIGADSSPDVYLDPARPYSNELALRRALARLRGTVFWYEQHMPGKALDMLIDGLDREQVTAVHLLSGPVNVTAKTKRAFVRFSAELFNDGISCEWRVISQDASRGLHARAIFDDHIAFELPPLNSLLAGTVDSIRESQIPRGPFDLAWQSHDAAQVADVQPPPPPTQRPAADAATSAGEPSGPTAPQDEPSSAELSAAGTSAVGTDDDPGEDADAAVERERWTAEEMVLSIRRSQGAGAASAAQAILRWADQHEPPLRTWFSNRETGSFMPGVDLRGGAYLFPVAIYSAGTVELQFQHMLARPQRPFDQEAERLELQRRINQIAGVHIPVDRLDKRPGFPLRLLSDPAAHEHFLNTLDWAFDRVLETLDAERRRLAEQSSIMLELSEGAARRDYLLVRGHEAFFPIDAFGGSRKADAGVPLTLHLSGTEETVQTDITDWQGFRCRAPLGRFYAFHQIHGGRVRLERTGDRAFRLSPADDGSPAT